MTNLTQQQLDELGKLLETNQGSDVDEFLEQIFNAAQTEPKNTDTLYETSPATDSEHLETLHEQPPEFHTDNAQTLLGEYCTDDPPEPISQTRGKNRQAVTTACCFLRRLSPVVFFVCHILWVFYKDWML